MTATNARLSTSLLEAILFATPEPVRAHDIASAFGVSSDEVMEAVEALRSEYASRDGGVEVRRVGDAFRIYTKLEHAEGVGHFANRSRVGKLSKPALETLAIVAYRQPVTRGEISRVRGVDVDSVLQTLGERGLITEVGRESGPGRAPLFGTTPLFLEKIGLGSLADLPPLASFAPDPQTAADIERALTSPSPEPEDVEPEQPAEQE